MNTRVSIARALLVGPVLALSILTGCSDNGAAPHGGKEKAAVAVPVTTAPVVRKTMPVKLQAIGNVEAFSSVAVRSGAFSGRIEEGAPGRRSATSKPGRPVCVRNRSPNRSRNRCLWPRPTWSATGHWNSKPPRLRNVTRRWRATRDPRPTAMPNCSARASSRDLADQFRTSAEARPKHRSRPTGRPSPARPWRRRACSSPTPGCTHRSPGARAG